MTKIYCWVNSGVGTDWQEVLAIKEDGEIIGSHVSSTEWWAMRDIEHHVNEYADKFPDDEFEAIWVSDPLKHEGLRAAYAMNQARRAGD